jgi:hypothetical protein
MKNQEYYLIKISKLAFTNEKIDFRFLVLSYLLVV